MSAPAHSPKTAPITETLAATLSPLKKLGRAEGNSAFHRVWRRVAPMLRISFSSWGSTARRPSVVFTARGKKQTRATIASFGPIP